MVPVIPALVQIIVCHQTCDWCVVPVDGIAPTVLGVLCQEQRSPSSGRVWICITGTWLIFPWTKWPLFRRRYFQMHFCKRKAIIWTNADPIQWRIYAALRRDELKGDNQAGVAFVSDMFAWYVSPSFLVKTANSLAPGRSRCNIKHVIFYLVWLIGILNLFLATPSGECHGILLMKSQHWFR